MGSGLGEEVLGLVGDQVNPEQVFTVTDDRIDTAMALADEVRRRPVDVLVGIGGGRTLDVAKYAATAPACRWWRWPPASPTTASPRP